MRRQALGATLVAAGLVFHAVPASADKLDDVLARLEAIEKNNAKLANENATLKARLNRVETKKEAAPAVVQGASYGRVASAPATGIPTPPMLLAAPEIDAKGHGFFEHKKGNPLTFYTPGGEITAYGNLDVSVDATSKSIGNMDLNGASAPVGNFGWLPAISSNSSYLGVRGFQELPNFPLNFVYQLEVGFDISSTPGLKQSNSHRRLQSVRGPDRRHACHHGQYRRRQPRRIRRPA
jgi:hypothetical protein